MIDPKLLALIVCPADRNKLEPRGQYLVCVDCGRRYRVDDGIPNLLLDEALPPEPAATNSTPA